MPVTYDKDADNTAVVVRTGATILKSLKVAQRATGAAVVYLQLFNTASITPGTTAPVAVVPVPAGSTIMDAAVLKLIFAGTKGGGQFSTALGYCCTTTHDGSTSPTAGQEPEVIINWEPLG
jgi:hypothetical protein